MSMQPSRPNAEFVKRLAKDLEEDSRSVRGVIIAQDMLEASRLLRQYADDIEHERIRPREAEKS